MNTGQKNHSFLKLFCIAITWVFLLQGGNGLCSLTKQFHNPSAAQIELVVQKPLGGHLKNPNHLFSLKPNKGLFFGHLEILDKHSARPFIESFRFLEQSTDDQPVHTPTHHLLSILKKKNRCHQSSDNDPLPHEFSLS
ncbi:MAG: hypothetical protein HY879_21580 [Deltaproteobacteria bacterium]|nr:hypothetical protein [Deltaproteobacteria bacterium]